MFDIGSVKTEHAMRFTYQALQGLDKIEQLVDIGRNASCNNGLLRSIASEPCSLGPNREH